MKSIQTARALSVLSVLVIGLTFGSSSSHAFLDGLFGDDSPSLCERAGDFKKLCNEAKKDYNADNKDIVKSAKDEIKNHEGKRQGVVKLIRNALNKARDIKLVCEFHQMNIDHMINIGKKRKKTDKMQVKLDQDLIKRFSKLYQITDKIREKAEGYMEGYADDIEYDVADCEV